MQKLFLSIIMISLTFCSRGQGKPGYEVNVTIKELKDSTVYLGYHFGDKQYIKDTLKLDDAGKGTLSGAEKLPQGIYMIVLPGKQYFEVLMPEDQHFSITCSYPDYYGTLKFSGSDENNAFVNYQKHWMELQKKASGINNRLQGNRQNPEIGRASCRERV